MRIGPWLFAISFLPTLFASTPSEGWIPFHYQGEIFQTYYKVFGKIDAQRHAPLVIAHGGPGLTHDYLLPFADVYDKRALPVIFYDQIGNGKSTHLRTKPASFWSIDLFISELLNLINYFQIQNSFSLVGHSWGGILASEFAVQKQPTGLKRLILTDSLASSELWAESNLELMQAFPEDVQEGLLAGMTDPPKFAAALRQYYAVHGCRVLPLPEEYLYSLDQIFGPNGDPTVASTK
jgi:proline-specific peptidase